MDPSLRWGDGNVFGEGQMTEAYICDAIRTPIGRYGGSLSAIRDSKALDDDISAKLKTIIGDFVKTFA